jgi:hypothetical protein
MIPKESNERVARIRALQEKTDRHLKHLDAALIRLAKAEART